MTWQATYGDNSKFAHDGDDSTEKPPGVAPTSMLQSRQQKLVSTRFQRVRDTPPSPLIGQNRMPPNPRGHAAQQLALASAWQLRLSNLPVVPGADGRPQSRANRPKHRPRSARIERLCQRQRNFALDSARHTTYKVAGGIMTHRT